MQNAKILIPAGKNLMHYKINNTYIYTHTHTRTQSYIIYAKNDDDRTIYLKSKKIYMHQNITKAHDTYI